MLDKPLCPRECGRGTSSGLNNTASALLLSLASGSKTRGIYGLSKGSALACRCAVHAVPCAHGRRTARIAVDKRPQEAARANHRRQSATARTASRWDYPLRRTQRATAEDTGGCVLGHRIYI
jgi:hypothetical protein